MIVFVADMFVGLCMHVDTIFQWYKVTSFQAKILTLPYEKNHFPHKKY